jgi:hypothetical protein
MATVATQQVTRAGLAPAYAAASAGGDSFRPGPTTFLHVKNASAGAVTATVVTPGKTAGLDIADLAVAVPAGGEVMVGPLPGELFNDPADGLADITWSAAASVTFAAVSV